MFTISEHRNRLETFSLHWHALVLDIPVGSKLHSPLLDLIYIGSPGVLYPDVGTIPAQEQGRLCKQDGKQCLPVLTVGC